MVTATDGVLMDDGLRQTYEALALLTPYDIDLAKTRVGNERDGAYIIVEPDGRQDVLSFGISDDVSFERAMADRGHRCFLYDHTISALPETNPTFHWRREGICSARGAVDDCRTLKDHISAIPDLTDRLILKIDVEGAEWEVFRKLDDQTLAKFDQILIEFHWMRLLDQPGFHHNYKYALENINRQFTLHHVHANNCGDLVFVSRLPVADVLEVSYVRSDLVNRSVSRTVYPTDLNRGNRGDRHDIPLLFFPFAPSSVEKAVVDEMISRIDHDLEREDGNAADQGRAGASG